MATLTKAKTAGSKAAKPPRLQQFIGGKWIDGAGRKEIVSLSPSDMRQTVAVVQGAGREDALKALDEARKALPKWKAVPPPQRGRILQKFVDLARARKEELARLMALEQGKILPEAMGEMEKGINLVEWFAGEGMRLMGVAAPSELPSNLLYTIRQPMGVVSVITPWNFPWAIPCWKIAPALVAGNTVVFKPASLVPALSVEIARLWEQAGLPAGALNLVIGAGSEIGNVLVEDPRVRVVTFTGSNSVGKGVHTIAGARGIKVTCEMGGKNPCLVMDDADLDLALAGVVKGAFGATGQRCTATSRLLLQEKIADKFLDMVVRAAKAIKPGDALDPKSGMGPAVDESQLRTDLDYIRFAQEEGARLLCGGRRLEEGALAHGYFVEPTVFDGVSPKMRLWREEVFGPVLAVTRFSTYEEGIALANDCEFGLTSAIYTQNLTLAMRFAEDVESGMTHINSPTIGGEAQVPFGGIKGSGVGEREMAKEGMNFFTELKTVFLDYTGRKRESSIY